MLNPQTAIFRHLLESGTRGKEKKEEKKKPLKKEIAFLRKKEKIISCVLFADTSASEQRLIVQVAKDVHQNFIRSILRKKLGCRERKKKKVNKRNMEGKEMVSVGRIAWRGRRRKRNEEVEEE